MSGRRLVKEYLGTYRVERGEQAYYLDSILLVYDDGSIAINTIGSASITLSEDPYDTNWVLAGVYSFDNLISEGAKRQMVMLPIEVTHGKTGGQKV